MSEPTKCSNDPNKMHGFDRNASHNAGRYVCICEDGGLSEQPITEFTPGNEVALATLQAKHEAELKAVTGTSTRWAEACGNELTALRERVAELERERDQLRDKVGRLQAEMADAMEFVVCTHPTRTPPELGFSASLAWAVDTWNARIAEQASKLAAAERDAARYRWLRASNEHLDEVIFVTMGDYAPTWQTDADSIIDSAMSHTGGEGDRNG